MIKISDGKIGSRESFILIKFMISLEISDMTATFLFSEGKTATWAIPIIAGISLLLPFLVLLSLLKEHKNKGLIEMIYTVTGKYIGFIMNIFFFIVMLVATVVNSRNYISIIQTMFLPNTPVLIIFVLLLAASCFIAKRGLEVIGRTGWLLFPVIMVVIAIIALMSIRDLNPAFLFPIQGPGIIPLLTASVKNNPIVADIFLLTALYPYVRSHREFKVPVLLGFALSIIELAIFFAIYIMTYDYPSVTNVLFPFQQLTMLINVGRYIINFESFFFLYWVIASLVRYAIYLYLTTAIFSFSLRMKEFEPLLIPMTVLVFLLGMLPNNLVDTIIIFRQNYLIQGTWFIFIIFPFVLYVVNKLRRKKT